MSEEAAYIEILEQYAEGSIDFATLKRKLQEAGFDLDIEEEQFFYQAALDALEDQLLRQNLQQISNELKAPIARHIMPWKTVAYAASFVGIIALAYFGFFQSRSEASFEDYFETFPDYISMRSPAASMASSAMENYASGDYEQAVLSFEQIVSSDSATTEITFYAGVNALALNKFQKAISYFEKASTDPVLNEYWQQVNWYLGLAYWQQGQKQEAIKQLSAINAGEYNYEQAQELLLYLQDL